MKEKIKKKVQDNLKLPRNAQGETIPGTKSVANRIVNAENDFIKTLQDIGGIDQKQAEKVFSVFRKFKLIKMDPVGGRISVKHGAYLEKDVILNALNL